MTVELGYLGRALRLAPAVFGEMFHDVCTVQRIDDVVEWVTETDAMTGEERSRPERRRKTVGIPLYWYAESNGVQYFCTYSGYGPRILAELKRRGIETRVRTLVSDGLGKPDLSVLKDVVWRTKQREVFARLLAHERGMIDCPTAFGKSFICCQLARVYPNAKIIYTVPQLDVVRKVFKEMQYLLPAREVGIIGDGRNKVRRVNVVSSRSLHNAPKDTNLILADECHSLMTEEYVKKFNKFLRARIFGLSASIGERTDKADAFGEALFGPVLIKVDYNEGVAGGNIVPINVRMFRVDDGPDVSGIRNDDTRVNRIGIWRNERRNEVVAKVTKQVQHELGDDAQILVIVATAEHAYSLGQKLPDFTIVTDELQPGRVKQLLRCGAMIKSQELCTKKMREEYTRAFEQNTLKRVIATMIWKQGVDFRDLACLVRADGQSSGINAIQVTGRLSRLGRETDKAAGLLIDFYDSFSRNLKYRSDKRLRIYRKNGWSIARV